jgi:uncharacterized repeat protein (TIGR02543 family)
MPPHLIVSESPPPAYYDPEYGDTYNKETVESVHPSSTFSKSALGACFKSDGSLVTKVHVKMYQVNDVFSSDTISACIYASNNPLNTSGLPVDPPLGTSQPVNFSSIPRHNGNDNVNPVEDLNHIVFTFPTPVQTEKDKYYYVVVKRNQVTASYNSLLIHYGSSNKTVTYFWNNTWVSIPNNVLFMEVYGEWPPCDVTYNGNGNTGGSVPVDSNSPYTGGATVTVLGNTGGLVKTGSIFKGWALTSGASSPDYLPGATFTINAATTLYAVWAPVFSVTYSGNGHTGGSVPVNSNLYEQGAAVPVAANTGNLIKANWTFKGWALTSGAASPAYTVSGSTVTPANHTMSSANVTFYAVWQENAKYAVTYNGNGNTGGSPPVDSNSPYYTGSTVTVLGQATLTKTNWTFKGWNTNSSATTAQYTQGQTFTINAATTLYAIWGENQKFTVTYNGNGNNGGSAPVDSNSPYYTGATVTVLGNTGGLSKNNYTFIGWNTNSAATTAQYVAGNTFTILSNTTLYAIYQENPKYSVTYNGNGNTGGSIPTDSTLYYQNATVNVAANPGGLVKTNNIFKGWATSSTATTPTYTVSGSTVTPPSFLMGMANVTLWAVWVEEIKYSVTYNGNGNTGGAPPTDANSPYIAGSTVTVQGRNTLVKTGYVFLGWSTNSSATSPQYTQGQTFNIGQNMTFYAVWIPDDIPPPPTFNVTYNSNAPSGVTVTGTVPVDTTDYLENQTVQVKANIGGLSSTTHNFLGWALLQGAASPDYVVSGSTVTPPTFPMGTINVTLYAVWTAIPLYKVTYQHNGATTGTAPVDNNTYMSGATVTILGAGSLQRKYYTFIGWNTDSTATAAQYTQNQTFTITTSMILYAVWKENSKYTVTYMGNGNTSGTAPVDYNSPYYADDNIIFVNKGSLARAGYTFEGWALSASASLPQVVPGDTGTMGASNIILYAVWKIVPVTYNVIYNANWPAGQTGAGSPPLDINNYGSGASVQVKANINNLMLSGYRFIGWATSSGAAVPNYAVSGDTVTPPTFQMGTINVTLYAVWEKIVYHTVTYWPNGAITGDAPLDTGSYEQGDKVYVLGNVGDMKRTGYTFIGWATSSGASSPNYVVTNNGFIDPATFTIGNVDVHLYAVWQLIVMFTVTYQPNGATGGEVPENQNKFMAGSKVSVRPNIKNLVRTGYIFQGWATTASAATPEYAVSGSTVTPDGFTIISDVVLYAVWLARVIYTVKYYANWPDGNVGSGSVPVDSTVYYSEDTATVQANPGQLLLNGYTFSGWIYNNQMYHLNGAAVTPSSILLVENVNLYAVWIKNEPALYIHYGTVDNTKILIRAAYVHIKNPPKDELITPVLSKCLVMATDWVEGLVSAAGLKVPFVNVPSVITHICELYAAGRYLQRSIPEEKTHPYIIEAQEYLEKWLLDLKENGEAGLDPGDIRPPAIALGRFPKRC